MRKTICNVKLNEILVVRVVCTHFHLTHIQLYLLNEIANHKTCYDVSVFYK